MFDVVVVGTGAAGLSAAGAGGAANAPIAVVGTSCRCPAGATSLEAFWSALAAGVDAAGEQGEARRRGAPLAGMANSSPVETPSGSPATSCGRV